MEFGGLLYRFIEKIFFVRAPSGGWGIWVIISSHTEGTKQHILQSRGKNIKRCGSPGTGFP
jgi:hypothetical protein